MDSLQAINLILNDLVLTSGESVTELAKKCKSKNWLGIVSACVSPEIIENTVDEIKDLKIPFGYKANLWEVGEPLPVYKFASAENEVADNPAKVLGSRNDYTDIMFFEFTKKMISKGATILGGCCETKPFHIKKISSLKN